MRIYTKTGDNGTTGLYGGARIEKSSPRIQAIGDVDELNSVVGIARCEAAGDPLDEMLAKVQNWLFDLGGELASPPDGKLRFVAIKEAHASALENSIDNLDSVLSPLKAFVLPGGSKLAATLHLARCVCRRAERSVLELHSEEPVRDEVRIFLNRLSDWLFTAARTANRSRNVEDIEWKRLEEM